MLPHQDGLAGCGLHLVVLDDFSTYKPATFYEFLPPDEARAYLDRFEFYFTPVHGSWLNMAEIEWSTFGTECLGRRTADKETFREEIAWWNRRSRNPAVSSTTS